MKKVKIGFWLIIIAFLALVGYQNKAFFLQKHTFDLNIWVTAPYETPEVYNAMLFGACFVAGLIIAYLSSLFGHFKANKTIKQLTKTVNDQKARAEQLQTEIDALKNVSTQVTAPLSDEDQAEDTVSVSAAG